MSIQTRLMYDDNSMYAPEYAPASATPLATYKELRMSTPSVVETAVAALYIAPAPIYAAAEPAPTTDRAATSPTSSPISSPSIVSAPVQSAPVSASIVAAPIQSAPQITESARKNRRPTMDSQVSGTITQVFPARVVVDGATVDSLAGVLDGATYLLDDRVLVQIRNPQIPLLMGVLS